MNWEALGIATVRAYGGTKKPTGQAAKALVDLMKEKGMPLPLASPSSVERRGVGLRAIRTIEVGEEVLNIPPALWVPHSSDAAIARAKAEAPALLERLADLDEALRDSSGSSSGGSAAASRRGGAEVSPTVAPLVALVMQILFSRDESAYLRWLHVAHPTTAVAETFPAFWPNHQLHALQRVFGSHATANNSTHAEISQLEEAFPATSSDASKVRARNPSRLPALARTIHRTVFGDSQAGHNDMLPQLVLWALTMVQSRATNNAKSLPSSSSFMPFTMVPYFDLLNHASCTRKAGVSVAENSCGKGGEHFVNCVQSFDTKDMSFKVTAVSKIESDDECFISYGDLPNARLLPLYGFCLDNNPYDSVPFHLLNMADLPEKPVVLGAVPSLKSATNALALADLEPRDLVATKSTPLPEKLVNFAQAQFEDEASPKAAALRWLESGLRKQAAAYGTSLDEDLNELTELRSQAPLCTGSWRENCLVARIGEKQIIDAAIREARRQWRPIRR